jgi:hypothetical protein
LAILLVAFANVGRGQESRFEKMFDGTFEGWEGDTRKTWRIEDGMIVAGSMENAAPQNEFLTTNKKYSDFDLRLKFKTTGTEKINCGIQFRSERLRPRIKNEDGTITAGYSSAVVGYQADIGENVHGRLYDEHRRRKFLAPEDEATRNAVEAAIPEDGWQSYRILAVGNRVQLWLNGVQTVDYTETDESVWTKGSIGLQIHGQMIGTVAYKDITIRDLSGKADVSIEDMAWIAGSWKGDGMGGQFEETWNAPMGGEMMGMFKLVSDGEVKFYEIMAIVPEKGSYVLRLKHFSPGLVGWEEKDKSVEFPLLTASSDEVRFDGLTFQKSDEGMSIEVLVGEDDGQSKRIKFKCQRVTNE